MQLLLIGGFLGSGKTTFSINLAERLIDAQLRIAILVNEIGEIGIDDQLMRQLDLNVWELMNGCVCCTLAVDLVSTLQQLERDYHPDIVILEPSGAADPSNVHSALTYYEGENLSRVLTLTLLDPLRLSDLYEVMTPLITRQIVHADTLILTKIDLASEDNIQTCRTIAQELNPAAELIELNTRAELPADLIWMITHE